MPRTVFHRESRAADLSAQVCKFVDMAGSEMYMMQQLRDWQGVSSRGPAVVDADRCRVAVAAHALVRQRRGPQQHGGIRPAVKI